MSEETVVQSTEEVAPGTVVTDQQTTEEVVENQEEVQQTEEKKFSQEELDSIVGKRLERERRKWKREIENNQRTKEPVTVDIKREDFATEDEFIEAKADAIAEAKLKQRESNEIQQQVEESWIEKVEKAHEKYPDFDQVIQNPKLRISTIMAETIKHADNGDDIAYYLGTNPKEAERISKLSPMLQVKEIGKLEATLQSKPIEKKTTSAPPPITPMKSKNVSRVVDTTDPRSANDMSPEEWIAAERQRQMKMQSNG